MRNGNYKLIVWNNFSFILIFSFFTFLASCGAHSAINRTENYIYAWPNITYTSTKDIAISIIDKRPYVITGKNDPAYVGLMRGGFNNPWYMNTESGKPLVEDLSQAVVSGYKNAGINVELIQFPLNTDNQKIFNYLLSNKSSKKLLIIINEWQSDTFSVTTFLYDITAEIYNEEGAMVAKYTENNLSLKGENQTVASPVDAGRTVLTKILNNKTIITALQ